VHDDPLNAPCDGPTQWVSFIYLMFAQIHGTFL